ncbi:MAG TPA: MBL fold metallo-hydrolase [Gemmatimonadota bacterium]|nr:MBL fold metallo-hydrolase [Gemmatimonadota bacterium]
MKPRGIDRRTFLAAAGSCAAHLVLTLGAGTATARRLFAAVPLGRVVGREPWGRLEKLAEGAWALVSTPLAGGEGATRTFSNGGIIAGREGVLVVEGFASEEGATWLAGAARELTGRWPTHVVLTHYHGDHSSGLAGYEGVGTPIYVSTVATREDLETGSRERGTQSAAAAILAGERVRMIGQDTATIDLGGRVVRIVPRSGHTRSDLAVVVEDPRLVWCGDLVWNGLFPNYMDATPSDLSRHVRDLLEEPAESWVPGHGSLADRETVVGYLALLDDVEEVARRAIEAGRPAEEAASAYRPPAELGEWVLFSPGYYAVAFRAWERELGRAG